MSISRQRPGNTRSWLALGAALGIASVAPGASANVGGAPGYSGKPNATAPQGASCNNCHGGGTAPQVMLTGPTSRAAGQSGAYSLVVTTNSPRAGATVAATDGVTLTAGEGMGESFGEMVQDGAATVSGGKATFRFSVTAPLTGTTLKLWAAGLAAGGQSNTGGDAATLTTLDVTVTGGMPSSSGGADGGVADSGTSSSSSSSSGNLSSGSLSSGGASDGGSSAMGDEVGGSGGSSSQGMRSSSSDVSSCAQRPATKTGHGALALLLMASAAVVARWRRPRRRS